MKYTGQNARCTIGLYGENRYKVTKREGPAKPEKQCSILWSDGRNFDLNLGTGCHNPSFKHSGKDTFLGHNTVSSLIVDCTAIAAFLADLSDLQKS